MTSPPLAGEPRPTPTSGFVPLHLYGEEVLSMLGAPVGPHAWDGLSTDVLTAARRIRQTLTGWDDKDEKIIVRTSVGRVEIWPGKKLMRFLNEDT